MFLVLILLLSILVNPPKAYAYLDPGTGSYIIQIAIATLLGGAFAARSYFKKIANFFKQKVQNNDNEKKK